MIREGQKCPKKCFLLLIHSHLPSQTTTLYLICNLLCWPDVAEGFVRRSGLGRIFHFFFFIMLYFHFFICRSQENSFKGFFFNIEDKKTSFILDNFRFGVCFTLQSIFSTEFNLSPSLGFYISLRQSLKVLIHQQFCRLLTFKEDDDPIFSLPMWFEDCKKDSAMKINMYLSSLLVLIYFVHHLMCGYISITLCNLYFMVVPISQLLIENCFDCNGLGLFHING